MVPKFGIYGYALANLFSFIIFSFVRFKSIKKMCNIQIKFPCILSITSFCISYGSYLYLDVLESFGVLFIIGILFLYNYKELLRKIFIKFL